VLQENPLAFAERVFPARAMPEGRAAAR